MQFRFVIIRSSFEHEGDVLKVLGDRDQISHFTEPNDRALASVV